MQEVRDGEGERRRVVLHFTRTANLFAKHTTTSTRHDGDTLFAARLPLDSLESDPHLLDMLSLYTPRTAEERDGAQDVADLRDEAVHAPLRGWRWLGGGGRLCTGLGCCWLRGAVALRLSLFTLLPPLPNLLVSFSLFPACSSENQKRSGWLLPSMYVRIVSFALNCSGFGKFDVEEFESFW